MKDGIDDETKHLPQTSVSLDPTKKNHSKTINFVNGEKRDWVTIAIVTFGLVMAAFCTVLGAYKAGKPKNYKDDYHYQRQLMELKAEQDFKKMQEEK